jgi:hypothetical protein
MRLVFIISMTLCILIGGNSLKAKDSVYVRSLIQKYQITDSSLVLAFFTNYGECSKFMIHAEKTIRELSSRTNFKIQAIAFLTCKRAMDTTNYAKNYSWNYAVEANIKNLVYGKLDNSNFARIVIYNHEFELIKEIDGELSDSDIKKIIGKISSK